MFDFTCTERELRAWHTKHGGEMRAHTSEYGLAVADAGMRQIYADRQEYAARVEQIRQDSQQYGEEALAGFYKLQANGMVNIVNDATKIVGLPELPKFDVGGEYWANKKQVGETATTIGVALATGGATLPGDLLLIGSSAGNMAEAVKGTDFRTGEELTTRERIMRGAGAIAVRGTVDDITEAVSSGVKSIKSPANMAEAVTAQGVSMRVAVDDAKQIAATQQQMAAKNVAGTERVKPINLPSWKTIKIKIEHIASGHIEGSECALQSGKKTLFPPQMSEEQIQKAVLNAYRYGKKISTQVDGSRVLVEGYSDGLKIHMYVNLNTKTIETAYPKFD